MTEKFQVFIHNSNLLAPHVSVSRSSYQTESKFPISRFPAFYRHALLQPCLFLLKPFQKRRQKIKDFADENGHKHRQQVRSPIAHIPVIDNQDTKTKSKRRIDAFSTVYFSRASQILSMFLVYDKKREPDHFRRDMDGMLKMESESWGSSNKNGKLIKILRTTRCIVSNRILSSFK